MITLQNGEVAGDLWDICARNHGGNENSVAARKRTNAEADRHKVYAAIKSSADRGMTCDELEVALHMSHQSCSARVSELKARGMIAARGKRPTRTGCKASVMVTPER